MINYEININVLKKYIYPSDVNFRKKIDWVVYRIWNGMKHLIGKSDWDIERNRVAKVLEGRVKHPKKAAEEILNKKLNEIRKKRFNKSDNFSHAGEVKQHLPTLNKAQKELANKLFKKIESAARTLRQDKSIEREVKIELCSLENFDVEKLILDSISKSLKQKGNHSFKIQPSDSSLKTPAYITLINQDWDMNMNNYVENLVLDFLREIAKPSNPQHHQKEIVLSYEKIRWPATEQDRMELIDRIENQIFSKTHVKVIVHFEEKKGMTSLKFKNPYFKD